MNEEKKPLVYTCFCTDNIHEGHLNILREARKLGEVVLGVLCDEEMVRYNRFPIKTTAERVAMVEDLPGIKKVIVQDNLLYDKVIRELHPDIVVHGDNWKTGPISVIRQNLVNLLAAYGGKLVEIPYTVNPAVQKIDRQMKEKIFAWQGAEDFLVLNHDDPITRAMADRAASTVCFFSRSDRLSAGAFIEDGEIVLRWQGKIHRILPVGALRIRGAHNVENALAACAMAFLGGAEPTKMAAVLREFPGIEHRIEPVAEIGGVRYYNDSKATNTDSAIKALESFPGESVILIAGGEDKMTDLTAFMTLAKAHCPALVLVGDAAERFRVAALAAGFLPEEIHDAGHSLAKAVDIARRLARPSEVVLLSPACASFDMFPGYEARGRAFKALVKALPGAGETPPVFSGEAPSER